MKQEPVEWAGARRVNWIGSQVGDICRVRVLARRGKWVWVQINATEPFTVRESDLSPDPIGAKS